jgi:hypothetical protein
MTKALQYLASIPGRLPTALARVPGRNWAWAYFKAAVAAWALSLLLNQPKLVTATAQPAFVRVFLSLCIIGAVISIIGMIMSSQYGRWIQPVGVVVELSGILLAMIGPLCYGITQVSILAYGTDSDTSRLHLVFLAHALFAGLFARGYVVARRFWREATDTRKAV